MENVEADQKNEREDRENAVAQVMAQIAGYAPKEGRRRRVHVIINPAAGRDLPILSVLNSALQTAGVEWDIFVTKDAGDAARFAREAVQKQVDLVAVYGGDGTITEAASGLISSTVPLAILPGGTANVMALEVGVVSDLVESCALALNPDAAIRKIDMGRIGDRYFLLRAGMGFEAAMVEGADREKKDRLGVLAYGLAALQALANPPLALYRLELDGEVVETQGITCIVANSGVIGRSGRMTMAPNISVSDGLLDVIVIRRADLPSLISLAADVMGGAENPDKLLHWQVKKVSVESDPEQNVQLDGEMIGKTPIIVEVVPKAINMIVPSDKNLD